ncbi:MAG: MtsA protein [Myxococcaceae bacterium]
MKWRGVLVVGGALVVLGLGLWVLRAPRARLIDVGPRLVTNQTPAALALLGENLRPGMMLRLGAPLHLEVPLAVLDSRHAYARLPQQLSVPHASSPTPSQPSEIRVALSLGGEAQGPELTIVNDAEFVDLTALVVSPRGDFAYALSGPTDTLYEIQLADGAVRTYPTGDGPTALCLHQASNKPFELVVTHRFSPEIWVFRVADLSGVPRKVPAPLWVTGLALSPNVAFVVERLSDTARALSLIDGRELWRRDVDPNPQEVLLTSGGLIVGSLGAGTLNVLDAQSGERLRDVSPQPEVTTIVGGGTEKFAAYIMGGKAVRGLAWDEGRKALFVSSIGPNIGPNPARMEVSMNGGIGVVRQVARQGVFQRHRGQGAGIPEGVAVDAARGLVYQADIGSGTVLVFRADALLSNDAAARESLLQEVPIPPPDTFPLFRARQDFGRPARAGIEVHSGPKALALSSDGAHLYVLNRFTGTLAELDVTRALEKDTRVVRQIPVADTLLQKERRLGQVLYHADMGRSAMSCDACHLEGDTEGVLFEKTRPLRIYRSTGIRGARETPPYFTPASTDSLAETARDVGSRNRFQHPVLSGPEVESLSRYAAQLVPWPNPNLAKDGSLRDALTLPGGRLGNPRKGQQIFEGPGECVSCHPAPHFTLDQSPETRGRYLEVGTPKFLPIRPEQQDPLPPRSRGYAIPSLIGAWDTWPMFGTGSAGFGVRDGRTLEVKTRTPIAEAISIHAATASPGVSAHLSSDDWDHLVAYVLSL